MEKIIKLLLGIIALVSIGSCSQNKSDVKDNPADTVSTSFVSGVVVDIVGNPLSGVLVTSGNDTTATNECGVYALEQSRALSGRSIVKFEKLGYFSVVRTAEVIDEEAQLDAVMVSQEQRDSVCEVVRFKTDKEATINVGGMSVFFPANSISYDNGDEFSGSVFASVYYLNPNAENFVSQMPGGDMSGVDADGNSVILISYGMVEVTLRDSANNKLQIKKGNEATLSFPVPVNFSEEKLYEEIPLWHFDEEKGTWIEEGKAKRQGDKYVGNVKHFSWCNLDQPSMKNFRVTIEGYVKDENGKPIPRALVNFFQALTITDKNGYYEIYAPPEEEHKVTVELSRSYIGKRKLPVYTIPALKAGSVYQQDIVVPSFNMRTIKGKVLDTKSVPISGVMIRTNSKAYAVTNRKGEYTFYVDNDESIDSMTLCLENQFCIEGYRQEYKIGGSLDEVTSKSYDFVVPRKITAVGYVLSENNGRLDKDVDVTIEIDGKRHKESTINGCLYFVNCTTDNNKITAWIDKADYAIGSEKVEREIPANYSRFNLPSINVPTGVMIQGCVNNTCGLSCATVTLECGRGKDKIAETIKTSSGYFRFTIPFSMQNEKKSLKIMCQNKTFKKKIESNERKIDLGDIDICTGKELEPNCIYVQIENKIVKFDISKGAYTEMMEYVKDTAEYSSKWRDKYQMWCKSEDYKGILVIDIENNYRWTSDGGNAYLCAYLITEDFRIFRSSRTYISKASPSYTIKLSEYLDDAETISIYGSASIAMKKAKENISESYVLKGTENFITSLLIGKTNDETLTKFVIKTELSGAEERQMKRTGFKDVSTYMSNPETVSTIMTKENAVALVSRNQKKLSTFTIISRNGIDSESLSNCWKVYFSDTPKKAEYMWKNEAEIADLIMFGQLAGVKFERTKIDEEKCGCSAENKLPMTAN